MGLSLFAISGGEFRHCEIALLAQVSTIGLCLRMELFPRIKTNCDSCKSMHSLEQSSMTHTHTRTCVTLMYAHIGVRMRHIYTRMMHLNMHMYTASIYIYYSM